MRILRKYNQSGVAFLATVILAGIIVVVCTGLSLVILRDAYTVKQLKYKTQAYFLAEAGIEEGIKEIKEDFFGYSPSGSTSLGAGTYSIRVINSNDTNLRLIVSTGIVRGIARIIRTQVRFSGPEAFNYPALGGGKMYIAGGSIISNGGPIMVHANSSAVSGALFVGSRWGTGTVSGDASACGQVIVHDPNGTVTGSVTPNAPYVDLPPFDANFFQWYYDRAAADGNVKTGTQLFFSDPCAGTTNKICYVNGQVRLIGTWTMTGCIVATGKIIINKWASGVITQQQHENLPAFMSINNDVEIWDPTNIEGMVYAGSRVKIDSLWGAFGASVIDGSAYGRGRVILSAQTNLHYIRPDPPGLPTNVQTVSVVSWSR